MTTSQRANSDVDSRTTLAAESALDVPAGASTTKQTLPPLLPHMRLAREEMIDRVSTAVWKTSTGDLEVRDTCAEKLSGGLIGFVVYRARQDSAHRGLPWHWHDLSAHLSYVTRGWAIFEFEGIGEVLMEEGTLMFQPAANRHREFKASDDFEIIEITLPAQYPSTGLYPDGSGGWTQISF